MSSNSQRATRNSNFYSFDKLEPLSLHVWDDDFEVALPRQIKTEKIIKETWLSKMPAASSLIVTGAMILLLSLVSVFYWQDAFGLQSQLAASGAQVFANGEWWRLFTALFIHSDTGHLASNSLLFFVLGYFLYGYFGWSIFPVQAFIAGALTNAIVLMNYDPRVSLLGASGIVFWMGGMWLTMYMLLDRRRSVFQRTLRAIGVGLLLFFPVQAFDPSISYLAHTVGFFLGIAWGLVYFFLYRAEFRAEESVETVQVDGEMNDLIAL